MKKVLQIICCALGSGMIGFFANQLNTVVGCVFFTFGVALLVGSIILVSKQDKDKSLYPFSTKNHHLELRRQYYY